VTRWDAFADVCGYLRAGFLGGRPPRQRRNREWKQLIELSSFHYVTPSLAGCLHDEPGISRDIRDYLDAVLTLNGRRNLILLEALSRIVATFNAVDIEPVLLKGCARLLEGEYPAPNMRFLGDLDILVPTNRATDAYAALMANGFAERPEDGIPPPDFQHLRVLHEDKTGAGVEIHRLVTVYCPQVLSTPWFWKGTRPFRLRGNLHVRLPDPTRSACHNIVHDQFDHERYQDRTIELRQLLDLALIRKRHEAAIDWAELDHLFCRNDLGEVLATYLRFCEALLGQKAPRLRRRPRAGAIKDFRRIIDPPKPSRVAIVTDRAMARFAIVSRYAAARFRRIVDPSKPSLGGIVIGYAKARRRDPRGALKLFIPATWPGRLRLLKDAFKTLWT
jgi:hypothetical protein